MMKIGEKKIKKKRKNSGDGSSRSIPQSSEPHASSRGSGRASYLAGSLAISECSRMVNSSKDDTATDGDMSSGDSPPSNSSLYSEGEKVLAYHGPRIYEAKVPSLLRSCFRIRLSIPLSFSLIFPRALSELVFRLAHLV